MLIFKEDSRTGVSCGLNDFGELLSATPAPATICLTPRRTERRF